MVGQVDGWVRGRYISSEGNRIAWSERDGIAFKNRWRDKIAISEGTVLHERAGAAVSDGGRNCIE